MVLIRGVAITWNFKISFIFNMVNSKGSSVFRKLLETSNLVHKIYHWGEQNKPMTDIKRVKIIDFI